MEETGGTYGRAGGVGVRSIAAAIALAAAMLVALWPATPRAAAGQIPNALGIPCSDGPGAVQECTGEISTRVASWDGVPLDVNLTFPPPDRQGPFPLIVYLHGWGGSKNAAAIDADGLARQGYAVMAYSARGFDNSCGSEASRGHPGCERGWIHLSDARFEARDTQHLAGLLADDGLVRPRRIGVTGDSYGGGQSLILATLKNRVMRPNGKLRPWRSPGGERMRIAAAAPRIGWSDLAYSLTPNGGTLDFRSRNPLRMPAGVGKQSYLAGLFAAGRLPGFYAPAGADPESDLQRWFDLIEDGEPYDSNPAVRELLRQIKRFHSAYYLQQGLPKHKRKKPAPVLIYNAWTDDLFPADEALRYVKRVQIQTPGAKTSMFFANGFGHPRAGGDPTPRLEDARDALFARYVLGDRSSNALGGPGAAHGRRGPLRPGVQTFTQNCDGAAEGPYTTRNWRRQHPGEVRFGTGEAQTLTSEGGRQATAAAVDPVDAGGSCRSVDAADDPGAATYRLPPAGGNGYTLMGSPTAIAKLRTSGKFPQIASRLWDVAPGGTQTLVARGVYRPTGKRKQVFQLHPNGWRFEPGHAAKLELLGQDAPYARPSNGSFAVRVKQLRLELPVRERAGGPIRKYSPPK